MGVEDWGWDWVAVGRGSVGGEAKIGLEDLLLEQEGPRGGLALLVGLINVNAAHVHIRWKDVP